MPDFSDVVAEPAGKPETRAAVLAARRALSAADRASAAASIQVTLADVVRRRRPTLVTAYVPIGPEPGGPDLPAVLAGALPPGGRLLLPILLPDLDLDWADYRDGEPLASAGRGLREPAAPRLGVGAVARAPLVVVPAVAVDRTGTRLGRGGGSFDRALARVGSEALVVAPLYDTELLDALRAEPHDRRVDAVVTPSAGLINLGPGRGGGAHTAGRDRVG